MEKRSSLEHKLWVKRRSLMDGKKPTYLGDGVYAKWDGWYIWLGLEPGERLIALEPPVMRALRAYEQQIEDWRREEGERADG